MSCPKQFPRGGAAAHDAQVWYAAAWGSGLCWRDTVSAGADYAAPSTADTVVSCVLCELCGNIYAKICLAVLCSNGCYWPVGHVMMATKV